ncbi:sulfatase-like hydrolase/transferase [Aureliella helgolandensis]|uniref:Choline-sulfatase n=1 Tax=Aureliella helgolandensis TaxID=2527968 RepID=A0A518G8X9_9BACT|nr:sulfatase-like hydrolase/transferase [Aureliella helgolandensis]QDV25033.1 Choline-sulfatase [Aureliella helgolandensis]
MRYGGIRCLLLCTAIMVGLQLESVQAQEAAQPNILLLFTDDQCFDTIAALGNTEVITPNLDKLAKRGVSFSNAYNMGGWNGAICVASRTMMNTGRFLWRAHQVDNELAEEARHRRMIPQVMHDAGYETYMTGKWHVKIDANKIYDHVTHVRPGMPKTVEASYQRPNEKGDWSPWDPSLGGFWEGGKHWSEVVADDAEDFLEQAAKSPRPFFMYLAFNAPHDPRQAPREFVEMYHRTDLKIPANFLPEYPYMEAMGAGKSLRDERLAPWPRTPEAVQLHRQEYYALITHLDVQIGRILAQLESTGQADNTYIVMTADHGLACGQHGLLGKQSMFEHSMKAPLIVVGPGIPADKRIETPVYVQDFTATAIDWAGAPRPETLEFQSLLPIIAGQRQQQYDVIYGAYMPNKQRMIRAGDFKLVHYPKGDTYQLFNLREDPHEITNLAANPDQTQRVSDLKDQLAKLMHSMDDPMLSTAQEER